MEIELELFSSAFQPVGRGTYQVIIRRLDDAITQPRRRRPYRRKLFGKVREKLRTECQRHGRLGREPRWICIRRLCHPTSHESAAARRAQNQQDGQKQPKQPLPHHPDCLTCFRPFAKKIFIRNGADGGGRTHTSSRILDFESSASANSATSATNVIKNFRSFVTLVFVH